MRSEGCLPLVACSDVNIIVASTEVELGVDPHTASWSRRLVTKWIGYRSF